MYAQDKSDFKQRSSLTHGSISQKNIDEAVDQRRKHFSVCDNVKDTILNIR